MEIDSKEILYIQIFSKIVSEIDSDKDTDIESQIDSAINRKIDNSTESKIDKEISFDCFPYKVQINNKFQNMLLQIKKYHHDIYFHFIKIHIIIQYHIYSNIAF